MKSKKFSDAQENEPPIKVAQCCQPQQSPSNRAEGGCYNLYTTSPRLSTTPLVKTQTYRKLSSASSALLPDVSSTRQPLSSLSVLTVYSGCSSRDALVSSPPHYFSSVSHARLNGPRLRHRNTTTLLLSVSPDVRGLRLVSCPRHSDTTCSALRQAQFCFKQICKYRLYVRPNKG